MEHFVEQAARLSGFVPFEDRRGRLSYEHILALLPAGPAWAVVGKPDQRKRVTRQAKVTRHRCRVTFGCASARRA